MNGMFSERDVLTDGTISVNAACLGGLVQVRLGALVERVLATVHVILNGWLQAGSMAAAHPAGARGRFIPISIWK
jgi:hypothetical protein